MNVAEALKARVSVRVYKPDPVHEALLRDILVAARFAPSGGNVQPWKVIAVSGDARDAVCALARKTLMRDPAASQEGDRVVYPPKLWEPYRTRRFKVGEDMYALLGIAREDRPARLTHVARNFDFFGAPVGLFFVIDKNMGHHQWLHLGMFMQSLALAATERGLSSCFQEFWARFRDTLHAHFQLLDEEMIVCGMALGYADEAAPVNSLRSEREAVDAFASFKGF
jgi:nitroreductase